jgi:RNA polymerase sigma-B factor
MQIRPQNLYPLLNIASGKLSERLGRAPNASELAAELGVSRDDVIAVLVALWRYDAPSADCSVGDDPRPAAAIAAFEKGWDAFDNGEISQQLCASLPQLERAVLLMRFIGAMTQTQIAAHLGISQLHVSELLATSLGRLRANA